MLCSLPLAIRAFKRRTLPSQAAKCKGVHPLHNQYSLFASIPLLSRSYTKLHFFMFSFSQRSLHSVLLSTNGKISMCKVMYHKPCVINLLSNCHRLLINHLEKMNITKIYILCGLKWRCIEVKFFIQFHPTQIVHP